MKPQIPMKSGDEYDALTKWRRVCIWKPGQIKKIKRSFGKKVRRAIKLELFNAGMMVAPDIKLTGDTDA